MAEAPVASRPPADEHDAVGDRLVTRFQAGDEGCFAALYECYAERVFAYLLVVLADRSEAEDATQEVFLRVLKALPGYEPRGRPLSAWIFTIARHHFLDRRMRMDREQATDPANLIEPIGDDRGRPLGWSAAGDNGLLLDLVSRLPSRQRQILGLRYVMDCTFMEIAQVTGLQPDAVRQQHQRALSALRARAAILENARGSLDAGVTA
jgi:RNA polymerase sigma-70 factor (ECF subfamily)